MENIIIGFLMGFVVCLVLSLFYIQRLNKAPGLTPIESNAHEILLNMRTKTEEILGWINEELDKA